MTENSRVGRTKVGTAQPIQFKYCLVINAKCTAIFLYPIM